jgi:putative SOS response-associated peptidase YedK
VYFPSPKAALPVALRFGEVEWIPWGRRREEAGHLPPGGWARLDSIQSGKWERYHPHPVQIIAQAFMEKDPEGQSHWFPLEAHQRLQGLLAIWENERRLYVVTLMAPTEWAWVHDRWPSVVTPSERAGLQAESAE